MHVCCLLHIQPASVGCNIFHMPYHTNYSGTFNLVHENFVGGTLCIRIHVHTHHSNVCLKRSIHVESNSDTHIMMQIAACVGMLHEHVSLSDGWNGSNSIPTIVYCHK
jgi:hypothetical protein